MSGDRGNSASVSVLSSINVSIQERKGVGGKI